MTKRIYYLYHIFGKKIGVTRNLKDRLTVQQGYQPGEYEVLDSSEDIDYISERELELQLIYGYKIDRQSYKNLINKYKNEMKLNVTEQTTTFPFPINKLKGNLFDNLGVELNNSFGSCTITPVIAEWIMDNANVSMYNPDRTYIYNKALHEFVKTLYDTRVESKTKHSDNVYDLIRQWANERGIYTSGDAKTQCLKLQEEVGELSSAILKNNKQEIIDAIGDCVVVLTNLAVMKNLNIEDCIEAAYNEIKNRKGSMQNGTFVKEDTLLKPNATGVGYSHAVNNATNDMLNAKTL
jgi:NTP pyrophosphatase (non-canonical NTP hydrolase)